MIDLIHRLAWIRIGILAALGLVIGTYIVLVIYDRFRPRF